MIKMDIGKVLHEARTQANKSLYEIHELTKVTIEHLEFIESNNFSFLPSTYVKSFLKAYADVVGVDVQTIMKAYATNLEQHIDKPLTGEEFGQANLQMALKERVVEWCLGFGTVILFSALIFVYIQYRSHIHAEEAGVDKEPSLSHTEKTYFQIGVTSGDSVWVDLKIDGNEVHRHVLKPGQNIIWTAEQKMDLTISRNPEAEKKLPDASIETSHIKPEEKNPKPE